MQNEFSLLLNHGHSLFGFDPNFHTFSIDLHADVTSVTVSIETLASGAVFVTKAFAIHARIMTSLSKCISSCHLEIKVNCPCSAEHDYYMSRELIA